MKTLITSGGGAKGAFTVGALLEMESRGIHSFDLISGTSTGALIATMTAINRLDILEEIYSTVNNDDILTRQNVISNLTANKPYFFDTQPLNDIIEQRLNENLFEDIMNGPTVLALNAVSLQTGRITVFTTKPLTDSENYDTILVQTRRELINALKASSNQAAFMEPVSIDTGRFARPEQFVDGGHREVVPAQIVVDQNPTEIFVLSNNPKDLVVVDQTYNSVLDILFRAISIFVSDVRSNDLRILEDYVSTSGTQLITIEPDFDLDTKYPTGLRFNQDLMISWMHEGKLLARRVLNEEYLV